jgi:hypothetical protein
MGLKDYFHPVEKDAAGQKSAPTAAAPARATFSAFPSPPSKKTRSKQPPVPTALNNVELSSIPSARPSFNGKSSQKSASGYTFPTGDFRNSPAVQIMDMKADVMTNWLYQRQQERIWIFDGWDEGVLLKKARDDYVCCPENLAQHRNGFYDSIKKLNVKVSVHHHTHEMAS